MEVIASKFNGEVRKWNYNLPKSNQTKQ
jgi:hypothetical protein